MALLHYRDDAGIGGSLRVGQAIGNHLDPDRIEAHFVFAYGGPGPVTATSRIPVHFVNATGAGDLAGWNRLRRLIRDLQPSVLHYVDPVFWMNVALCDWRGPRIGHLHGPLPERIQGFRDRLTIGTFRVSMTCNVCVSKDLETRAIKIGAAKRNAVRTIYNTIDCARFRQLPESSAAREQLGLPRDACILGMICRLVPEKGCRDGIRLLKYLPADFHLMICGTGVLRDGLKRDAAENGLQARVHFLEPRDSVLPIYAAIDNLLFLSRTEPFGLVLAEAMASGIPIVGLAGEGGYSDPEFPLITQDNARLIRPNQPISANEPALDAVLAQLAETIVDLRNCPEARNTMIANGREWVEERFDVDRQAGEMAVLYESVLHETK